MADDDEDRWLYGDSSETAESKESDKETALKSDSEPKPTETTKELDKTASQTSPTITSPQTKEPPTGDVAPPGTEDVSQKATPAAEEEEDSDDDSDDDDVQITIGDIKSGPPAFGAYGPMKQSAYRKTNVTPASSATSVIAGAKPEKTLDLDAEGTINGVGVYSFDLDSVQEKPWNKPGADITDYFNYGLNEAAWKIYSEKQRKLRSQYNIHVHHGGHHAGNKDNAPQRKASGDSVSPTWQDKHRKPFMKNHNSYQNSSTASSIGVIGSSISTISRRRDPENYGGPPAVSSVESSISTVGTNAPAPIVSLPTQDNISSAIPSMHSGPPPSNISVMQMSQPPPNMSQPPPNMTQPPPRMAQPPPRFNAPPSVPIQTSPPFHNGPPPAAPRPYLPVMNQPPPQMNTAPPPTFNSAPMPPLGVVNMNQPPPTSIPPPSSGPPRLPPVSSAPPRMGGPPPDWNRPPFYGGGGNPPPQFRQNTPPPMMGGPAPPGIGPGQSPPPPGQPGGPAWDRPPPGGFSSFPERWSPRAPSEESDISSGSDDYRRSPRSSPSRGAGGDDRREYRSRDQERPRDRSRDRSRDRGTERRGRYAKENSKERDKKRERERSHERERSKDKKSKDREDRHKKRKDRDDEKSDGHRSSSRHKRSKHSHRDSEKEERSSSHSKDDLGKDLIIAESV